MSRVLWAIVLALGLLGTFPATALAHPLGNFTVNHLSIVTVEQGTVRVRYVLDLAEIPTLQETDPAGLVSRAATALDLRVDGRAVPLRAEGSSIDRLPGQAGLDTLRVAIDLIAATPLREGASLVYRDRSFPGRVGWHDVVLRGAVSGASAGPDDPTDELRAYPSDPLAAPPDRTEASARIAFAENVGGARTEPRDAVRFAVDASTDRLTAFLRGRDADIAAVLAALLVATVLGALHALGPGHGKAVVAAYLVGSKGTAREAAILGATVTVTHTAGVYALGALTLAAAQIFVPEAVYPLLGVASGVLVTATGAALLRSRLRRPTGRPHDDHDHAHGHGPGLHHHDRPVGLRGLVALGVSGGLLPCPTALVILLAAVSFHNVLLGMALVAAFSVGLAGVLTGIGLALVWGRGLLASSPRAAGMLRSRGAELAGRYLPATSAAAITVAGVVLTLQTVRGLP